jgi:conflict system pore-forming effector with SLATT domain/uncharacterized protein DUF4231
MAAPAPRSAVHYAWTQQRRWSSSAKVTKARIVRRRHLTLWLTVVAAALSAVAIGRHWSGYLAVASASALALAAVVARRSSGLAVSDWVRLRSISEALKSEVYEHLAGVGRYRTGDRDALLLDRVEHLADDARDLVVHVQGQHGDDQPLPAVRDADSYVAVRIHGQITDFYEPQAARMAKGVRRSRYFQYALATLGVLLAVLALSWPANPAVGWLGVVTTATTAVIAYAAAAQFEFHQVEYARTAGELERLRARWQAAATHDQADEDEIVTRAEGVISIQNQGWMVKWTVEPLGSARRRL